jgi:MFS family permease
MMAADTVRALAVAALAAIAMSGPAHAYLLVPVAGVLGAGAGLFLPGSFSIVPSLLPGENLQAGNALISGGTQLAMLIGPAVGGAVVALVGPAVAFAVDAVSFVISVLSLAGVRDTQRPVAVAGLRDEGVDRAGPTNSTSSPAVDTGKGSNFRKSTLHRLVAKERALQLILAITVAANLASGGVGEVALPSLAHGPFHTGADGYGALIAALGAGALLGAVIASHAQRARRPAIVASVAFLGETVFLAIVPYVGGPIPAAAAIAGFGSLNGFGNLVMITAFQRWAPTDVVGRLMGLLLLASFGVFPLSVLLGGVLVHDFGPAPFFPLAAATVAAPIIVGLCQRTWRGFGASDESDERPVLGGAGEPALSSSQSDFAEFK